MNHVGDGPFHTSGPFFPLFQISHSILSQLLCCARLRLSLSIIAYSTLKGRSIVSPLITQLHAHTTPLASVHKRTSVPIYLHIYIYLWANPSNVRLTLTYVQVECSSNVSTYRHTYIFLLRPRRHTIGLASPYVCIRYLHVCICSLFHFHVSVVFTLDRS